eukprot:12172434-Alexandrium_andersonii.AAC.1
MPTQPKKFLVFTCNKEFPPVKSFTMDSTVINEEAVAADALSEMRTALSDGSEPVPIQLTPFCKRVVAADAADQLG